MTAYNGEEDFIEKGIEDEREQINLAIAGILEMWCEQIDNETEEHMISSATTAGFKKRTTGIRIIGEIKERLSETISELNAIQESISVVPNRRVEECMKVLAQSKIFRLLAEKIGCLSADLEAVENEWNDMPNDNPLDPKRREKEERDTAERERLRRAQERAGSAVPKPKRPGLADNDDD